MRQEDECAAFPVHIIDELLVDTTIVAIRHAAMIATALPQSDRSCRSHAATNDANARKTYIGAHRSMPGFTIINGNPMIASSTVYIRTGVAYRRANRDLSQREAVNCTQ